MGGPLQLEQHLELRTRMSTVQPSSYLEVYNAAAPGRELQCIRQFHNAHTGLGQLSSGEFKLFGFCDGKASDAEIATFAGKSAQQAFNRVYNDWSWYALTKNKTAFELLMQGAGFPAPRTLAIFDSKGRGAGAPLLKIEEDLKAFLTDPANHPVFCKPTTGLMSIGAFRLDGMTDGKLVINGRHTYQVEEIVTYMTGISNKGYLFQEILAPHDAFAKIGCHAIASLRFLVLNFEREAILHSAVLKLPASGEVADNFWRKGAMISLIAPDSGKIERTVLNMQDKVRVIAPEDETNNGICEFELPRFQEAKTLALQAARVMPGVKVQAWDVALTDKGPVLLEVNFGGDMNVYQLASGKGVMNKDYCDMLRASGFSGPLPN